MEAVQLARRGLSDGGQNASGVAAQQGPSGHVGQAHSGEVAGAHAPGKVVGGRGAGDDGGGASVAMDVDGDVVLQHLQRRDGRPRGLRPARGAGAAS